MDSVDGRSLGGVAHKQYPISSTCWRRLKGWLEDGTW